MNDRIKQLAEQAGIKESLVVQFKGDTQAYVVQYDELEKFAKLLVEAVLDQVKERAYYTGDRDWSDEVDRPWIQLEFGYGKLSK